jgi:hypothetical protein
MERADPSELLAALNRASLVEAALTQAIEEGAQVFASPSQLTVTPIHSLPIYRRRLDRLDRMEAKTPGDIEGPSDLLGDMKGIGDEDREPE